jgi:hypothetical protein
VLLFLEPWLKGNVKVGKLNASSSIEVEGTSHISFASYGSLGFIYPVSSTYIVLYLSHFQLWKIFQQRTHELPSNIQELNFLCCNENEEEFKLVDGTSA